MCGSGSGAPRLACSLARRAFSLREFPVPSARSTTLRAPRRHPRGSQGSIPSRRRRHEMARKRTHWEATGQFSVLSVDDDSVNLMVVENLLPQDWKVRVRAAAAAAAASWLPAAAASLGAPAVAGPLEGRRHGVARAAHPRRRPPPLPSLPCRLCRRRTRRRRWRRWRRRRGQTSSSWTTRWPRTSTATRSGRRGDNGACTLQHQLSLTCAALPLCLLWHVQICRRMRQVFGGAPIPIVMCTAMTAGSQALQDCKDAGATDFLLKPYERTRMLEKINAYCADKVRALPLPCWPVVSRRCSRPTSEMSIFAVRRCCGTAGGEGRGARSADDVLCQTQHWAGARRRAGRVRDRGA